MVAGVEIRGRLAFLPCPPRSWVPRFDGALAGPGAAVGAFAGILPQKKKGFFFCAGLIVGLGQTVASLLQIFLFLNVTAWFRRPVFVRLAFVTALVMSCASVSDVSMDTCGSRLWFGSGVMAASSHLPCPR